MERHLGPSELGSPVPGDGKSSSRKSLGLSSISDRQEEELAVLGAPLAVRDPAETGPMPRPASELIPQLRGPVHAEERRWPSLKIPLALHEGSERGHTVANKVVSLAKDVQVNLGHLWLQTHHLNL